MRAKQYLVTTSLVAVLLAALVAGVNYAVDPYAVTGAARVPGVNEYKVDINNHVRLSKKYQPLQVPGNALVIGNSRVEMGIDPGHRCFVQQGLAVYNLGLPGAAVHTQLAYALNLIYQQPVEQVFMSVDLSDFALGRRPSAGSHPPLLSRRDGDGRYLPGGEANTGYTAVRLRDYYQSLFSLDALISSARTLALQDRDAPDRDVRGFNPARDYAAITRLEGPRALFEQKLGELNAMFSRELFLRDQAGELVGPFADLDAFLRLASERDIHVVLFTNPFHDAYWTLLRDTGQMGLHARWLESVTRIAEPFAGQGVELWDFSAPSIFTGEPLPAGDGREALDWFWEPAHYRSELGDLMVEAMLGPVCTDKPAFGRRVF